MVAAQGIEPRTPFYKKGAVTSMRSGERSERPQESNLACPSAAAHPALKGNRTPLGAVKPLIEMVGTEGIEPPTCSLEGCRSIQLSYMPIQRSGVGWDSNPR